LLTSHADVVLKGGLLGRLLEAIVAYQFNRIGPRTLAAFSTSWSMASRRRSATLNYPEPPPLANRSRRGFLAFAGATGAEVSPSLLYVTVYVHAEALLPQLTAISRTMPSAPTVTTALRGAAGLAASS
jgi:hypothetical protein